MKRCGAAVGLGGDYKSPAPSVCSIERGSNGGLGPFEWAQSGKPCVQCYPRFKNLGFGCKSLELCADVASDVGIKAKSRLLRFL